MDDDRIKEDFQQCYHLMNGMTLTQMGTILDPVCMLCKDHQRSDFVEGVKVGVQLREELMEKQHRSIVRSVLLTSEKVFCC